jgi:hypothetical protein
MQGFGILLWEPLWARARRKLDAGTGAIYHAKGNTFDERHAHARSPLRAGSTNPERGGDKPVGTSRWGQAGGDKPVGISRWG